ncbi:MAG: putative selenium-dependent hydroxylase accessory protein YqeC [Chloroflexi bacterium]|nr:putative selenium-dependent hydroxylase accessory protein YqeC [Chloroflexota bacterium]
MRLSQAIRLSNSPCLALVGAGGKTTALYQLARELTLSGGRRQAKPEAEGPVVVAATTHLHIDQIKLADSHWKGGKPEDLAGLEENLGGVMLVTGPVDGDRTTGLSPDLCSWLREVCASRNLPLLIEADGSRQRPLKAPADPEPAIPEFIETVVVVAGLTGLGKPLTEEFVHRPEIFARLSGLKMRETITLKALSRLLVHPAGGLKNIPLQARRIVLLNQADTPELQAQGKSLAEKLLPAYHSVIIASLKQSQIHAVYEPVAGIILAGGGSSRFGQPKPLLDWHGKPFVCAVAETALSAGLSPVVVVTGANAEQVETAVNDLPVIIVRNQDWQNGQSSSIRAGLANLATPHPASGHPPLPSPARKGKGRNGEGMGEVGAAIFLLADQPQITPTVIRALSEEHARTLAPIVAPLVGGQRANPVLFDRVTFPDLMALSGDGGGRAIFSQYPVNYLTWHDESLLSDVDTPQEYKKLVNGE